MPTDPYRRKGGTMSSVLDPSALAAPPLADLHLLANELGVDGFRRLRKADLIDAIVAKQAGEDYAGPESAPAGGRAGGGGGGAARRPTRPPPPAAGAGAVAAAPAATRTRGTATQPRPAPSARRAGAAAGSR